MNVRAVIFALIWIASQATAAGPTNIDAGNRYVWSENTGWFNFRDANNGADGVRVLPTILDGFVWGENVGWINVGNGKPANGLHYSNTDGTDFGVNIEPSTGDLYGLAWGENIGWINFDTRSSLTAYSQEARVDFTSHRLRGYAWGENVGWINLDDAGGFVAFVPPACPHPFADTDGDGDVDQDDFGAFQRCYTGSNGGIVAGCECFNRPEPGFPRGDNDVDVTDLARFVLCRSGPGVPTLPGCESN